MYNKFDRIKIKCELNDIKVRSDEFRKEMSPDMKTIISEEFKTAGLKIKVNHQFNKLFIDFSAKLLGRDYVDSINIFNVREIYNAISKYIEIKPIQFYRLSPNYTEVVIDAKPNDVPETIEALYSLSRIQSDFKPSPKLRRHQNRATSFYLKKNVVSRSSNEYVSIYSKYNEMFATNKTENAAYLRWLSDEQIAYVKSCFTGVLRVEYKCESKARIRASYGLKKDYNLYQLLKSENNVVETIISDIYVTDLLPTTKLTEISYRRLDKLSTLKAYNNDLERIYETYKSMGGRGQKSVVLRPYKELIKLLVKSEDNEKIKLLNEIKEKLKWLEKS